jgi:hypothetical protein
VVVALKNNNLVIQLLMLVVLIVNILIFVFNFIGRVKPVYNGHPWDPKIVAVVHMWPLFRGFSIRVAIEFDCTLTIQPIIYK